MRKHRRILFILLSILFVLTVVFALSSTVAEADHECLGEGCPVCAEIDACEDLLKTAAIAADTVAVTEAVRKFGIVALHTFTGRVENTTLISLKVKLSN